MSRALLPMSMLSLLSVGAIFGFFYAWVCSTMWGLDAADPQIAIAAMQAMNASVRNAVFFPAFFLTPVFLAATALIAARSGLARPAALLGAGAALYLGGAFFVTVLVNVPMNEALAQVALPLDRSTARDIWQAYSGPWQLWNAIRAGVGGLCLLLTGLALVSLTREAT